MSETWKRTLSLPYLPKKLMSRRNLHAFFSKFGDVQGTNVNKDNRTGVVVFATHAEAKTAKNLGKVFENKPLKILWFENALETQEKVLDPRAREGEATIDIDNIWEDDDKECFGVEKSPVLINRNKSAKSIPQHLKFPKKKMVTLTNTTDMNKTDSESDKSPLMVRKVQEQITMKKKQASKRNVLRKEVLASKGLKKKSKAHEVINPTSPAFEPVGLKQKLSLLDERDKLIRQKTVQDSNIKTAVAIKGTCPDMCPERERILRQCRHQVALYESFPGTNEMDENKAIKEYIRSSADQEVPLPHDLRPAPVLSMTMSYLITNIINQIDDSHENKAVWYSFCWNRLRSIRKDIILQQLCDLETVTIVEQCARFHICCYDHMLGIDVSGYSDKINTNNLMDCLQTLKHLYEDLAKHNIKCPNEPEFHSYLILLKLTTGDVFWEYQQYPPEIQFSSKVQFAIEVYMAFINNMYSKYFCLVKKASYLESCLLQRYFDQVRTTALKMMLKAYSLPNRNVSLTIPFLVKYLKFDSRKNVVQFCEKIESQLQKKIDFDEDDNEDEYVSTSSYLIKDKRLPIAYAVVGENNPLPIYVPHQVHSSFDEEGKLREPLESVSDEYSDSYDTTFDKSDVSVPDVEIETVSEIKPFKFSLSPKGTQENVFNNNIFSRLGPLNIKQDNSTNKGLPGSDSAELQPSKIQSIPKVDFEHDKSFYEDDQTESIEMEEDMDEEMIYDEDFDREAKEEPEKALFFTEFGSLDKSLFGNQLSVSSTPTGSIIPANNNTTFFLGNGNQHTAVFSKGNRPSPKSKKEANSLTPKLTISHEFSSNIISKKIPFVKKELFQKVPAQIEGHIQNTNQFSLLKDENKTNVEIEVKRFKELSDKISLEKLQEKMNESLKKEQEMLKIKRLEEERKRAEEAKRAEIEKQKQEEKHRALEKLRKDLRERMKAKNVKKHLRLWKNRVEKIKKKRADFPMLQQLSVEDHLKLWGRTKHIPSTSVFQRAKDKKKSDKIVSNLLKYGINHSSKYIGKDVAELLAKSAAKTMNMLSIHPVFWKLVMSLPLIVISSPEYYFFIQKMRRCCREAFYNKTDSKLGSVESTMTSRRIPVHVSVHVSDYLQSCNLQGMDALIFVVPNGLESEKSCLERLHCLVSQARSSDFSVSVMTIGGNSYEGVLKMELIKLQEQSLIANWTVNKWTTPTSFIQNLTFLTEHVNIAQDICARPLKSLVIEATDDFLYAMEGSQVYCPKLRDALKIPNTVINLYNTFLDKLEDLLLSSELEKYFGIAEEFKQHIHPVDCGGPELMCGKQFNSQYKSKISTTISLVKLPEIQEWPVYADQIDVETLAELLQTYCTTQIEDTKVYGQIIGKLAREVPDVSSLLKNYSWLHIIRIWAESRFSHVFSAKSTGEKTFVIYNKQDLKQMIKKQWWITHPIVSKAKMNL